MHFWVKDYQWTFTSLRSITWFVGLERNHYISGYRWPNVAIPTNGFTGRWGGVAGQPENSHGVTVDFMYFSPCSALTPRLRHHFTQLFMIVSAMRNSMSMALSLIPARIEVCFKDGDVCGSCLLVYRSKVTVPKHGTRPESLHVHASELGYITALLMWKLWRRQGKVGPGGLERWYSYFRSSVWNLNAARQETTPGASSLTMVELAALWAPSVP